jgi:glutaredoxin-related protein
LTDVDQDACGFKNLVIDILQRYVGDHVLLNEVLRKDNWESGSLREHDAWDFRGDVV